MGFDICVIVEVCWELGCCVGDIEGHFLVIVDCPVCRAGFLDDSFVGIVVAG